MDPRSLEFDLVEPGRQMDGPYGVSYRPRVRIGTWSGVMRAFASIISVAGAVDIETPLSDPEHVGGEANNREFSLSG